MATRKFDISYLLVNAKRLIPLDIIIDYRFIQLDKVVTVSIMATTNNAGYVCLGTQTLFRPVDSSIPVNYTLDFNTDILSVADKNATGLMVWIQNAEYIDIKRIVANCNIGNRIVGRKTYLDSELKILSFTINDGDIFSLAQEVTLENVCNTTPLYYRASRFETFIDAVWLPYSTTAVFQLFMTGVNRIYFQVKNATLESDVVYGEIAWHGYEELFVDEEFVFPDIEATEGVVIENPTENARSFSDTVVLDLLEITDDVKIYIDGVLQ